MEQRFFAVSTATVIDTQSSFPTWTLAFIFQAVSCFLVLTLRGTPNNAAKQLSQNTTPVIILLLNFSKRSPVSTVYCDPHGKGFDIVNKAEIYVFLELSCFFHDPADVGNLISGSSAFSKTSWNIWKFMVHVLLKPGLENFEYYFTKC